MIQRFTIIILRIYQQSDLLEKEAVSTSRPAFDWQNGATLALHGTTVRSAGGASSGVCEGLYGVLRSSVPTCVLQGLASRCNG